MPSPPPTRSAIPISSLLSHSPSSSDSEDEEEFESRYGSEARAEGSNSAQSPGDRADSPVPLKLVELFDRSQPEVAGSEFEDNNEERPKRVPEPPGLSGVEKISFNECAEILYVVASLRPYRKPRGLKTMAWNAVLDTLHRNGYVTEKKLDWLKSRVRNLIEFHENGGFAALDDWNSNVVRSEEELEHKIKKRRRKTKKKFDLTESSIMCLESVSIDLGRDIRKYTQDWLSPLPPVREGSTGRRDPALAEDVATNVHTPHSQVVELRENFETTGRKITLDYRTAQSEGTNSSPGEQ